MTNLPTHEEIREVVFIKTNVPDGCISEHARADKTLLSLANAYLKGEVRAFDPMSEEEIGDILKGFELTIEEVERLKWVRPNEKMESIYVLNPSICDRLAHALSGKIAKGTL